MSILNFVVICSNVISVYLAAKNIRITWFFTFVTSVILAIIFFRDHLYMSFAFNSYCGIMSVWGMITWKRSSKENDNAIVFSKSLWPHIAVVVFSFLIITFNIEVSNHPVVDSICTSMSIVATWLLVRRNIWTWFYWILSDTIYIVMGVENADWKYFAIYGSVLLMDMYGGYQYNRKLSQAKYKC